MVTGGWVNQAITIRVLSEIYYTSQELFNLEHFHINEDLREDPELDNLGKKISQNIQVVSH